MDTWIIQAGAVAGALVALAALVGRPLLKIWKRVDAFLSDWNGEPARPGRLAIPSMPERMSTVERSLDDVRRQVTPNGGNTNKLGDRVVRIEDAINNTHDE